MIRVVSPGPRTGSLKMPSSKSAAHRMLMLAALSECRTGVLMETVSKDVAATIECLEALGAGFKKTGEDVYLVTPVRRTPAPSRAFSPKDNAIERPEAFAQSLDLASDILKDFKTESKEDHEGVTVSFGPEDALKAGRVKTAAEWLSLPEKEIRKEETILPLPKGAKHLYCKESGTTLRFMLPLAAALGVPSVFHMEGRLSQRPIEPLKDALEAHGVTIRRSGDLMVLEGQLEPGDYVIPGNVSSQFVSGLLFSLPLLSGESRLTVTQKLESEAYVMMTEEALRTANIAFSKNGAVYTVPGRQRYLPPNELSVESDWSSAAVFFCMGALSEHGISASNMNMRSCHADRRILDILSSFGAKVSERGGIVTVRKGTLKGLTIDASESPDLVPALCALSCAAEGKTRIENAGRLRLKESDRIKSTVKMLRALGADIEEEQEGIVICGTGLLHGGTVDVSNDHRIVMAAAVAAGLCTGAVRIPDSECVEKSYPSFFKDLGTLKTEEHTWQGHTGSSLD
ncbi:MAG: 3-phosphoshikimate 1-carboxyvinyltransferase [Lachnospiraceae bacterium]|nr:3-phosphoshikimate 1-carboxyvinyltransferase [Lachnospiraceae bacterium]